MKIGMDLLSKRFSLEDLGLYNKNAFAFIFMFVIPLLLACYVVFILPRYVSDRQALSYYSSGVVILMCVSGFVGYAFLRRSIKVLISIIQKVKNLSMGKVGGHIEVGWNDELKDLAQSFNRINTDLEAKIKELEYSQHLTRELFQQIGLAATGAARIDAIFNITLHGLRKILTVESGFIALYDDDNVLRLKAYTGRRDGIKNDMKLPDDRGVIGRAVSERKTIVADRGNDKASIPAGEDVIPYDRNIACAPIIVAGKTKGVVGAMDKTAPDTIGPEDVLLLESVAGQTGICTENLELNRGIEEAYYDTLVMLARVAEAKDAGSADHLERVSHYVRMMAHTLGLDDEAKKILEGGAILHDLGKVGIEDAILKKTDKFTPNEYEAMKQHSVIGENILKPLHMMSKLSTLVRHHHELYDGSGYPDGLRGEEIPLTARILAIADIYDALSSDRPYKKALGRKESISVLKSYAGNKLDPGLVEIFIGLIENEQ